MYKNLKNLLKGIEKLIGVEEVHFKNLIKECCHFVSLFLGHLLNKKEGKKKCGKMMKEKIMGGKGRSLGRAKEV
jgi:hypothetical protein